MTRFTPFVPGIARGVLRRGSKAAAPDSIAILTHQDLAELDQRPAGILVVDAAPFSHALIRLLTQGIPTVLIDADAADALEEGREIVIDGLNGVIHESDDADADLSAAPAPPPAGEPVVMSDGTPVRLSASIFSVADASYAVEQGAGAIGLLRSEFLLPPDGRIPDAGFYQAALSELCDNVRGLQVTIRLPDIAADKPVPWFRPDAGMTRQLGYQGVRLYDRDPVGSVVAALLDAIDTVADECRFRLLLPYVTELEEFSDWRGNIEHRLNRVLPVGAMLESPAAVMAMPHWFEIADFVAIGCNDLMQCFFATDRDAAGLSRYLDPYSPDLFRFLRQAADAADDDRDKVQLCGLLPQMPAVLPVMLGMGFRVFSAAPVMIPYLATTVSGTTTAEAQQLTQRVCAAKNSRQVRRLLLDGL